MLDGHMVGSDHFNRHWDYKHIALRNIKTFAKNDFKITTILNTHDHWDHIGGNEEIREKTGAKLLSHSGAMKKIPNVDKGLKAEKFL